MLKTYKNKSFYSTLIKRISINLLLLLTTISFVFFIGELLARFRIKAWPFESEAVILPHLTTKDKNLRWRFSSSKGLNSLGLRNAEIDKKEDHQFRILYLGDSMVWTGETSSKKLYTEVIENNLNKKMKSVNKQFEIINAGIPGYTTYQELEFLKVYGLDMQPNFVILGFVFNDVYYKYLHKPTQKKLLGREPEIQLHRFNTHSFPGFLFARSHLAHRVYYALEVMYKKIRKYPYFPFEDRTDFYLAWKEYGWNATKALIGEMNELLREKNIPIIVVIYPITNQVDEKYMMIDKDYALYPQKRIKQICKYYHIPFLDLQASIYKNGGTELYQDFLHMNNKGNDIIAEVVTQFLINNKSTWIGN